MVERTHAAHTREVGATAANFAASVFAAELAPNHYPITALFSELRTSLYGKLGQKAGATD